MNVTLEKKGIEGLMTRLVNIEQCGDRGEDWQARAVR